jgi:hypothetical protein
MQRINTANHHAGSQQRALDRVGCPPFQDQRFDMPRQRIEEIGRRRALARHRQVHLARHDFARIAAHAGVVEVPDRRQQ